MITLTKTATEFGDITIAQSRVVASHIYWQGGWQQSEADRNGVSLAAYVHAIFGLLAQTSARATLMIGCGGGTLGTMLARTGRSVIVVDINPQSIALARQYFSLPEHVTCYVENGASFLRRNLHEPTLLMKTEVLQDEIMADLQDMQFRGDCSEQTP